MAVILDQSSAPKPSLVSGAPLIFAAHNAVVRVVAVPGPGPVVTPVKKRRKRPLPE